MNVCSHSLNGVRHHLSILCVLPGLTLWYIRSAESGEEANYNMVDGLHNNRRKRKKRKKRRSVLKRLHEKQMEVARRERKLPKQELPQAAQEQEIERKPKNRKTYAKPIKVRHRSFLWWQGGIPATRHRLQGAVRITL